MLTALSDRKLLIGVDANARSPLWGPGLTNAKGKKLEGLISQWRLLVLNEPDKGPTISNDRGRGNPDVILGTPELDNLVKGWEIYQKLTSSDHKVIIIDLSDQDSRASEQPHLHARGYVTSKANLALFRDVFKKNWKELPVGGLGTRAEVIETIAIFNNTIKNACDVAIPKRSSIVRKVPWWTPALKQMKKDKYRARRAYRRRKADKSRISPAFVPIQEKELEGLRHRIRQYKPMESRIQNPN